MDSWLLRARFSVREWLRPPLQSDPHIVLVEIDDRSLNAWPEPLEAWGPHLADAIDRLRQSGARVIALDWVQPNSTARWFPGADDRLAQALSHTPAVVLAKELRQRPGRPAEWLLPTPELLYALPDAYADPESALGYAEVGSRDSVVAAVPPALPGENGKPPETSFAARVVERYCAAPGTPVSGTLSSEHWTVPSHPATPLRADGTALVNFANGTGSARAFARFSLCDVARLPSVPDARFRGKIVLIGATYSGCSDQCYVPFLQTPLAQGARFSHLSEPRLVSGVELQANLTRTLLSGRAIREPGATAVWGLSVLLSLIGLAAFSRLRWAPAAGVCLLVGAAWTALSFALFVAHGYALPILLPLLGLLLTGGVLGGYRAFFEERERQKVLGLWGRYQDPRLVEYLLEHPEARGGQGREEAVTVLFADLMNFTRTVEHLTPTDALQTLNCYLALISEVVLSHGGVVDKYLGDGLMALWGGPAPRPDHAAAAVRACLALQHRADALSASCTREEDIRFALRLTLHTGRAVAGWVGAERLEFTIIGDTVNVTARLQETAKELNCAFLVSETTYRAVPDELEIGQTAAVVIRGRQQPLRVYEVLGEATPGEAVPHRETSLAEPAVLPGRRTP